LYVFAGGSEGRPRIVVTDSVTGCQRRHRYACFRSFNAGVAMPYAGRPLSASASRNCSG